MRRLPIVVLSVLLFAACATSRPAATAEPIDPVTDPTIIAAVDQAVAEGIDTAEKGARIGRRVGIVAGVLAAVFGGPSHESLDDAIDRYRDTRDLAEITGATIGLAQGATEGAKRGYELDLQFAELHAIAGVQVVRPLPDLIEVHLSSTPSLETLEQIATVFAGRTPRAIDIEAPGDTPLAIRDALISLGIDEADLVTRRDDELAEAVLYVTPRA